MAILRITNSRVYLEVSFDDKYLNEIRHLLSICFPYLNLRNFVNIVYNVSNLL